MSRIFCVSEARPNRKTGNLPDYTGLEEIGEVVFIYRVGDVPEDDPQAVDKIRTALHDFDPAHDFISNVGGSYFGQHVMGNIIADVMREKGLTEYRYLRFDRGKSATGQRTRTAGYYTPITVDLS